MHSIFKHNLKLVILGILIITLVFSNNVASVQATTGNTTFVAQTALLKQLQEALLLLQNKMFGSPAPRATVAGATTTVSTSSSTIAEQILYIQKKLGQTNTKIATINAELIVLRSKLLTAKTALMPVPVVEKQAVYKAYTGSYVLETKELLTRAEAITHCVRVTNANLTKNVWCSWDKEVVSGRKPSTFVLGVSTTPEILELEDSISRLERRLVILLSRKIEFEGKLTLLRVQLSSPVITPSPVIVPPPIVPTPIKVPPVVITPPVIITSPPVIIPPMVVPVVSTGITPVICGSKPYTRKVSVANVTEFKAALLAAVAGDYIAVASGTYANPFVLENKFVSSAAPITICGGSGVQIKAAGGYVGYGFYLKNNTSIVLANISLSGFLKGVVLDNTDHSLISSITVSNLGNEGVHFRQGSSNNIIQNSTIFNTGLVEDWFGEGIYIGSAKSNWCKYGENCGPDKSDWNQVLNNTTYRTSAESVDIKEGTMGGLVMGNTFEGSVMTGEYADSFVDVKGNNYVIKNNSGKVAFKTSGVAYQLDGFQQHVVFEGYGNNNTFEANSVIGILPGNVVNLHSKGMGNIVFCNNSATPVATNGITNAKTCK